MAWTRKPATTTVALGACRCPGTPHAAGDTAEMYDVLGWGDLIDARNPNRSPGQRAVTTVTRAIASWTLLHEVPGVGVVPLPVTETNVGLLDDPTSDLLWPAAWAAFLAAEEPLPNPLGERSPASPPELSSQPSTTG